MLVGSLCLQPGRGPEAAGVSFRRWSVVYFQGLSRRLCCSSQWLQLPPSSGVSHLCGSVWTSISGFQQGGTRGLAAICHFYLARRQVEGHPLLALGARRLGSKIPLPGWERFKYMDGLGCFSLRIPHVRAFAVVVFFFRVSRYGARGVPKKRPFSSALPDPNSPN